MKIIHPGTSIVYACGHSFVEGAVYDCEGGDVVLDDLIRLREKADPVVSDSLCPTCERALVGEGA